MSKTTFSIEKMEKFLDQDALLKFMYMNLKGVAHEQKLELLYNSEIVNDSMMSRDYNKL